MQPDSDIGRQGLVLVERALDPGGGFDAAAAVWKAAK